MKNKKIIISVLAVLIIAAAVLFNIFSCKELKFAQLSDIHIWAIQEDDKPTYPEVLLKDAIADINSKPLDFTIITGDVTDYPNEELFSHVLKIFNNLKKPWYYAFGNHDRTYPEEMPREPLLKIIQQETKGRLPYGRYYSFQPKKGFTFIALDGSDNGVDDEQIGYLEYMLDKTPNDVIVIFMHTPIVPPVDDQPDHNAWNDDAFLSLLKNYRQPILILAGHFHATKIIQDGNVIHVASPSLRYAQEYRIIDIKNYKNKTVFNFDYKEIKDDSIEEMEKGRYLGEEQDKFATITIEK